MGSETIRDWLPSNRSAIIAADFKNPKELAEYILKVDSDPELYKSYFQWKTDGISAPFRQRYDNCAYYGAHCRLCQVFKKIF
jgi:hypothetical protein